jgi:hypothetical protein
MPDIEGGLSGLLSAPLVLPASVAGALAALLVVLAVIAWRRARSRLLLPVAVLAFGALAVVAVIDQLSLNERVAARRALLTREAELTRSALAPGSPLACLDAGAGDAVESACEQQVFGSAQSAAAAVAYMDARLKLLAAAAADEGDASIQAALASTRRAVALDRYGIAAHVLATRDACTPDKCAAFDLLDDTSALKANLKAQVFDQYVSRYVASWNVPAPPAEKQPPAVSAVPAAPPVASVAPPAAGAPPVAGIKPGEHWDFPSAASIPPVSIMNAEPPPPKGADAQAQAGNGAPAAAAKPSAEASPPVPPKRPQPQAAPPPAR